MSQPISLTRNNERHSVPTRTWWTRTRHAWLAALFALVTAEAALAQINVTAAWDPNTDGRTAGYMVQVGLTPGNPIHSVDVGSATSVVLPLPPGAVYYVAVRAYNASRQLGPAVEEEVDLANSPGAPENFRGSVSGSAATLSWRAPTTGGIASRYLLSVGTASGASNLLSEFPLGNVLSVTGALPPGTYYARLHAANLVGVGPQTPEVRFTVGSAGAPPAAPSGLAATWSGGTVTLRWSASSGATSYVLEAGTTAGAVNIGVVDLGGATAFSAPVPAGTFYVRVRARNTFGASAPSNEVVLRR